MKRKELLKAVETSNRSYEEIMAFLTGKDGQGKAENKTVRLL